MTLAEVHKGYRDDDCDGDDSLSQRQNEDSGPLAVFGWLSRSGNQLGPDLGRLAVLALTNTGEGWVGCLLRWGSSTAPGTLLLPGLRSL
jgi:hypothetical protein